MPGVQTWLLSDPWNGINDKLGEQAVFAHCRHGNLSLKGQQINSCPGRVASCLVPVAQQFLLPMPHPLCSALPREPAQPWSGTRVSGLGWGRGVGGQLDSYWSCGLDCA